MISLKIKMPSKSFEVEIEDNASVVDLRKVVAEKVEKNAEQLVLIFGGKILKDSENLETHQIKDKMSVHLVIKQPRQESAPKPEPAAPAAQSSSASSSTPAAAAPTAQSAQPSNPFAGLGGLGGMGNMQQMQQQLMQDPEMMRRLLDSPMMESIVNNPEMIETMMRMNPQMQQIMDSNPEIRHMFNNPQLIRQALEMARNPSMMQEMMRNQDRALSNLEALPGGMNALERLYRDVQEPMMDATARPNPFQNLANSGNNTTSNNQAGQQNTDALPNPWAPSSNTTSNTTSNTNTSTGANPPASNSMMELAMQMMSNNPDLIRTALENNPVLAGHVNPETAQQMSQAMENPNVARALQQIMEGYEVIRREAPQLMRVPGMPSGGSPAATPSASNDMMRQMLQQMSGMGTTTPSQPVQDPETRFASQLEQLANMGFTNRTANIEELQRTGGNVEAAIDRLLSRPR